MTDDDSDFLREVEAGDAAFLVPAPRKELPPWKPTTVTVSSVVRTGRKSPFFRLRFWLRWHYRSVFPG